MERKKTIVVDVDDTISVTTNRDYANAVPFVDMIEKVNLLYESGWEVIYFTARGQLSSNYDLEEIEKTRRPVLEAWLKEFSVKYDKLIMGKPFADIYLDDKAMKPEEFLETNFDNMEGRSGAEVSRVGDLVMKVAENTQMQVDWYQYNVDNECVPAPMVTDHAPSVYRMSYIEGTPGWKNLQSSTIMQAVDTIKTFKGQDPMPGYEGRYEDYVGRCIRMLPPKISQQVKSLAFDLTNMNDEQSFCHGDLTLTNMIVKDKVVFFIDPSVQKGIWSSWQIDVGRLMQSLRGRYEEKFLGAPVDDGKSIYIPWILNELSIEEQVADVMELLIHCRIWHHQNRHDITDGIETMKQILELIEKCKNTK